VGEITIESLSTWNGPTVKDPDAPLKNKYTDKIKWWFITYSWSFSMNRFIGPMERCHYWLLEAHINEGTQEELYTYNSFYAPFDFSL
jgi:hypothetical protein